MLTFFRNLIRKFQKKCELFSRKKNLTDGLRVGTCGKAYKHIVCRKAVFLARIVGQQLWIRIHCDRDKLFGGVSRVAQVLRPRKKTPLLVR